MNKAPEFNAQQELNEERIITQLQYLVEHSKNADMLIDFVKKLDQRKSGQLIALLKQRNLLFKLVQSQKNKIDYLERVLKLDHDIHTKLSQ